MKAFVKNLITKGVTRLPWGSRREILSALALSEGVGHLSDLAWSHGIDSFEFLDELARSHGIVGFIANGDYGTVRGMTRDTAVLAMYAKTGVWAAESNTLFSDFLSDGGTYLDIGGNIGLTVIPIARNPIVHCHVFEPVPEIYEILCANVQPFENLTTYNCALFHEDTDLMFETSPVNGGDNRLKTGVFENSVSVAGRKLDGLDIQIEGQLAVKIDTQGAEPFVIEGGFETLSKAALVSMEYSPSMISQLGGDKNVVLDFLSRYPKGCVQKGDTGGEIVWLPMGEVLQQLEVTEGAAYFDIFATV